MFALFRYDSFFSIWYWALTIVVWTLVCRRTLGVPHDMVLRADRLPEVADRVDLLARIAAERLSGLADALGAPAAAAAGFGLAALGALGYFSGVEAAKAAFLLLLPLGFVGLRTVELARQVHRARLKGEALRRRLARRRLLNQAVAVLAILTAAVAALGHPPRGVGFF